MGPITQKLKKLSSAKEQKKNRGVDTGRLGLWGKCKVSTESVSERSEKN